ncbi:unnamed protein product (macronuclear) [Paramecium tetraurelia]|uniref:Uncharacterized protein n=1 Tax=Paramecium tetraurelia TaxID=5888 RepID=A0C3S2_PARTE|nr:uncharacterized protein GSPATT00034918001 [Paramecium tetraurelia]CAK65439.1 unnamed protein product [Paramecium tetraurelia]|eukprot:XP_001432836.1 hypothetical protein (macronuclear) [Paramecium tetraurelia strain d4-2]
MQQRARSLIARQYYKNKYGPQLIEDDNVLDVQIGDDNTLQARQGLVITINSDDDEPKHKHSISNFSETVVKKQECALQKFEDRNSTSQLQLTLQQQLQTQTDIFKQQQNYGTSSLDSMSQLQKSLSQIKIQQPQPPSNVSNLKQPQQVKQQQQVRQPITKGIGDQNQKNNEKQKQRVISIPDQIQTKMNIESDEEEVQMNKIPRKQVRPNDDETLPQIHFKKKPDFFTQLKQKITQPLNENTALQIQYKYKQRDEQSPENEKPQNVAPVSYQDFIAMKNREINAAKQRKQDEEYRKQLLQQKKQEKVAPDKIREGETLQQYQQRMIEYLHKQNKYKNKKKYKRGTDLDNKKTAEEKQKISELMKMIDPNFQQDDIDEKPFKPDLLNYDVLLKNGLILKQAFVKPPEPDINPMLNVYKRGRYATEFIFSGGIDMDDGPYGQQSKKKSKKLPFPKHRLSLSPWEYYGVGPEEYFATRNPNFEFKQKYVPVKDYYNEMPRPKQNPKYFSYDVDQLLAKRYQSIHLEYQYQTSFIGYKQRHWTPASHLKAVCPNLVQEYEKYERDRLFCYIVCAKVSKYQLIETVGILTSKYTKNKIENLVMTYWKGDSKGEKKTISNLERQVPQECSKRMMMKKRIRRKEQVKSKDIQKMNGIPQKMEATERGKRNKLRKEKFSRIAEELKLKQQIQPEKNQKPKKNDAEGDQMEEENQAKDENQPSQSKKVLKKQKRTKKKKQEQSKQVVEQEANQFEQQFQQEQRNDNEARSKEDSEEQVFQDNEDLVFKAKMIEFNQKRFNFTGTDVDLQESMKLVFPNNQQQKLDSERYKQFIQK